MVQYTDNEVSNEVARVVRSKLSVVRDGGLVDTNSTYSQLKEMTSLALLLNPDSIYYVGKLACNRLLSLVRQEIDLVEDMLAALEFIPKLGDPIGNTSYLSNAVTSLLSVEVAGSVTNRPELKIFTRNIDKFLENMRQNVATQDGNLTRPREEARELLRQNLSLLNDVHNNVLTRTPLVRDLIKTFKQQDIPTKSATTVFENVRAVLNQLQQDIDSSDDTTNIARSRMIALKSLTAKALVNLVLNFRDPEALKYRSPIDPIPSGTAYYGRVRGLGTAANLTTIPGPWKLPISGDLQLKVDGGSTQTVPLTDIVGGTLNGRNGQSFDSSAGDSVYVLTDSTVDTYGTFVGSGLNYIDIVPKRPMGFKELGSVVQLPGMAGANQYPRALWGYSGTNGTTAVSWVPATKIITIAGGPFLPTHVGWTLWITASVPFEIVRYVNANSVEIDPRGLTPATGIQSWWIQGMTGSEPSARIYFQPALTLSASAPAKVGPTYRIGELVVGVRSAADVVADLSRENPPGLLNKFAPLVWSVETILSPADPTKVSLRTRNRQNPSITISSTAPDFSNTVPGLPVLRANSAHPLLGFLVGERDEDAFLTPSELVNTIVSSTTGLTASVQSEDVATGTGTTDPFTSTVLLSFNPIAAGARVGDQIEIRSGPHAGVYPITSIGTSWVEISYTTFEYMVASDVRIFSEVVKLESNNSGPGSSLEIVSAPSILGTPLLPVGVVYGQLTEFEAISKGGELLDFSLAIAGDTLKVTAQEEVEISEVNGPVLVLAQPLPSNVQNVPFQIAGGSARKFETLSSGIETVLTAPNLLANHKFDESLAELDAALTSAVIPGQSFFSNLKQAQLVLADLLAALTTNPRRTSEYSVTIPDYGTSLEDVLLAYNAASTDEINSLLDSLVERKYDRAYDLLGSGDLAQYYETTEETASYSGAVLTAARTVSSDLPTDTRNEYNVNLSYDIPVTVRDVASSLEDFSDVAPDRENY